MLITVFCYPRIDHALFYSWILNLMIFSLTVELFQTRHSIHALTKNVLLKSIISG